VGCSGCAGVWLPPLGFMSLSSDPYGLAPAVTPWSPAEPLLWSSLYGCGCQGLCVAPGKVLAASMSKRLLLVPRVVALPQDPIHLITSVSPPAPTVSNIPVGGYDSACRWPLKRRERLFLLNWLEARVSGLWHVVA
jgi:hypothetical protein